MATQVDQQGHHWIIFGLLACCRLHPFIPFAWGHFCWGIQGFVTSAFVICMHGLVFCLWLQLGLALSTQRARVVGGVVFCAYPGRWSRASGVSRRVIALYDEKWSLLGFRIATGWGLHRQPSSWLSERIVMLRTVLLVCWALSYCCHAMRGVPHVFRAVWDAIKSNVFLGNWRLLGTDYNLLAVT